MTSTGTVIKIGGQVDGTTGEEPDFTGSPRKNQHTGVGVGRQRRDGKKARYVVLFREGSY